jgi:RNA polymerase sigma factor (sigma-70 family)
MDMTNEKELITRARAGERAALDELVNGVKDLAYNLALRMLGSPADAQDATQEILIRVVTNLDSFRGDSAFRTWVYRVASNHLLKTRVRAAETRFDSLEGVGAFLAEGVAEDRPPLDDGVLVNEAKLVCTNAMTLALDRDHRLAFILGEVLELPSEEAAAVLEISDEAFRKRLSRARSRIAEFTKKTCGLVDPARPCRCAKQASRAVANGYLSREKMTWSNQAVKAPARELPIDVDGLTRAVAVMRSHPEYAAPESIIDGLKGLLATLR